MIRHITRATRHLLFWGVILVALLISIVRIFLASIDNYQVELEQKIRQISNLPVRFGHIEAGLRGFNPELILKNISIDTLTSDYQSDIQLREIRLGFDFLHLLLSRDWLASSRVSLVGARIHTLRNADGSISIQGLPASEGQPLWLLQGSKYEILDSEITWQDLKRHGEAVHFEHLDLVLKNHDGDGSHELHLMSRLPHQYGDHLRISAAFTGNFFQPGSLQGQIYIEGVDLQATALMTGDLPLGLNLHSGAGDVRIWSFWRDSIPYRLMGYIQAQQISISKNPAKPLHIDTFSGNFDWSDQQGRWRFSGYDIDIFAHHQHWPDGAFNLQQDPQGNLSATIKQLDLPAGMYLAPLLVPADNADWLKLNPKGRLQDVSVYVTSDFQHYAVRGGFEALGVDQFAAIPHLQGVSGTLSATESYGQIDLDSRDTQMNATDWFRNPLTIKKLQGQLQWWQSNDDWQFFSRHLQIDSDDFETASQVNLLIPKSGTAPLLDLVTRFGRFTDISQVPKYLPAKIMDAGAVDWLDSAFVAGRIPHGEMVVQGTLDQFPFTNGAGRFETVFALENSEIQYNAAWPHLRNIYADVQFSGADLQVGILEGHSEKVDINQAVVTIPDLADSENVFVWGLLQTKVMHSLAFLQKSPLKTKIAPVAKLIGSESDTRIDLDLKLPYSIDDPVKVNVNAYLDGAQLVVKPIDLKVENIKGVFNFTEDRISSEHIEARSLGYPIQGRWGSDDQANYLDIAGSTGSEQIEKQFPFLQNDAVNGVFSYQGKLKLPYAPKQPGELTISSSLRGVSVDNSLGLAKTAAEEKPLNLAFQFDDTAKLPLTVQYGSELQALFLLDKTQESLFSGHIVLGQMQANRYDQPGLKLDIQQPEFNLSQAMGMMNSDSAQHRLPEVREIAIDTGQLIWQDQPLGALHCDLKHAAQAWQGTIDSEMAKGRFQIPDQRGGNNPIRLQMDYLNLSAMDKFSFESADDVISELPLLDIGSKQLWWRGMDLGGLKLLAERRNDGIHFDKFRLQNAKNTIDLTADWLQQPIGSSTLVQGRLKAEGFGELLSKLNFTDDIKETEADIHFKGGWRGGPHQFSLARLNGQLQLALKDGRISSIEPGFGRLLGLIAMEQWVKRLSLDFTDVYRQGLAFDDIKGQFSIKDGLAYTEDLTVNAVSATFNIAGFVNLADKTLDQRVAVVPKSSDALPIAGTIVSGVAGIITRVVTSDYKDGYFLGSKYQLSGNWGNVEVTPLHDEDGLLNKTWRGLTGFGWLDSITQ